MNTHNISFFILDDEISIKNSPVTITVDHEVLMAIIELDDWESLAFFEKEFATWYQEEILIKGLLPGVCFIVDSSIVDKYNQDALCAEIMKMLNAPTIEDSDLF